MIGLVVAAGILCSDRAIDVRMTDPIAAFVTSTRASLVKAGLERVERDGSVYFRSPPAGRGEPGSLAKPVVVLLHGVNDQAGTWAPVVESMTGHFRLIVPDLAGHGESAPQSGPLPLPMILERLHAIIVNETNGPVALLGNSMGGWVAMLYTLAHPECVSRLLLEDASGMAWIVPSTARSRTRPIGRSTPCSATRRSLR